MNLKIMGAAALFLSAASFGGMSTAKAADLGGDCCSDLEERVAELEATTARKGNRKVSVQVYGQVNTSLLYFNNGDESDTYVGDNTNSPSRFGFKGSAKISPSLSAGFHIEIGAQSAPLGSVTEADDDGGATQTGDGALSLRFANWYLSHKTLGTVTVGRISSAMDGIQEIDLAGTGVVSLPGLNIGGKIAVGGTAYAWDSVMGGFDGDRINGIRYDTATFGGFQASASWGEDDVWDVTLRYASEFKGFRFAAGIGYGVSTDEIVSGEVRFTSGSLSVLHVASGLFATGFAGEKEYTAGAGYTASNWGARAGITKNWTGLGATVVFGEYNYFDNVGNNGLESEIVGVGLIQNIDAAAMELYLSYKNYSVDDTGAEDTDLVMGGARIKF